MLKCKASLGSKFTAARTWAGHCPASGHCAAPLERTENYQVVDVNGLTETFFTFGEIFLQQVSLGQRQVVSTGWTSLEVQQLMGKRSVNKLWRNSTPAQLGEQANHRHPQKDMAGGLTHI